MRQLCPPPSQPQPGHTRMPARPLSGIWNVAEAPAPSCVRFGTPDGEPPRPPPPGSHCSVMVCDEQPLMTLRRPWLHVGQPGAGVAVAPEVGVGDGVDDEPVVGVA